MAHFWRNHGLSLLRHSNQKAGLGWLISCLERVLLGYAQALGATNWRQLLVLGDMLLNGSGNFISAFSLVVLVLCSGFLRLYHCLVACHIKTAHISIL